MRPRLRALGLRAPRVGGVAVALAARAPQRTSITSYHQGPLGPYSAMSSIGAMPASASASRGREHHVRRRPRQHVDVEAASSAPAAKCPSVGESSVAPPPTRASRISNRLWSVVGRRRLGLRARAIATHAGGAPLRQRVPARLASRAPGSSSARAGGASGVRPAGRRCPIPRTPATRAPRRATPPRATESDADSRSCDDMRRRWTPTPRLRTIVSSCHVPFHSPCRSPSTRRRHRDLVCSLRSDAPPRMKKENPSPTLSRPSRITRRVWRS